MNKAIEYKNLSDAKLVDQLRNGDERAFNEIHNRYKGILLVHAYKKLGDYDEAKDVIQDMFAIFWNKRESISHTENISGYLYTITKNKALDVIARKKIVSKYAQSFNNFIDKGVFVTDHLVREKELAGIIEREVDAMPPKMKEVFILSRQRYVSHRKISEQLGITESTVKYHVKTALQILRIKLGLIIYLIIWFSL